MPANKNKLLRIQTILTMMRKSQYPNFTSFMREMRRQDPAGVFKLSSKTFSRDIADLRDEFHAPVRYDDSRKGFYLTNPEWYSEELMLEPFEMKAALLGERVASAIFPEPVRQEISQAVNSLLMKNESGLADGAEINNFQVLCPQLLPQIKPEIFRSCFKAWENHYRLNLIYSSSQKVVHEKLFEPHIFAWNGGYWYLKGLVHRDDDKRYEEPQIQVLALHRIKSVRVVEGTFFDPAPALLRDFKANGLFDFAKIPEVVVKFDAPFDKVVEDIFISRNGVIVERTAQTITIKLQNLPLHEILQFFFFALGHATIVAPDFLQDKVRKIAHHILERHPKK